MGLYSKEETGYAVGARKTASEAVLRGVLIPFPMRLTRFGCRSRRPSDHPAEARVQSSSSTKRSGLRPRTQEDR